MKDFVVFVLSLVNFVICFTILISYTHSFRCNPLVCISFQYLYEKYLTNFPTANYSIGLLKAKYHEFVLIFNEFQKELHQKNMLNVSDVLIMPVQRIPRYIMLFNTLQKYSNTVSPEYLKLKELQEYISGELLCMNAKISPDSLKEITSVYTFISSIQELDKEKVKIELDRRFLEKSQHFKIKDISNPNKKNFLKKRINFTLFTDIIIITKIPKKKLLSKDEDVPVQTYVDAGVVRNPGFFGQSDIEFTFTLNSDTYIVLAEDKNQRIFVSALNRQK